MSVDDHIVISNGRCKVALGLGARGRIGIGVNTHIDVVAGPFHGAIFGEDVGDYGRFLKDLSHLHQTLKGTAWLGDCDGLFTLALKGNGRGEVVVTVEAAAERLPRIALSCEFAIDQTYLPAIIERLTQQLAKQDKA